MKLTVNKNEIKMKLLTTTKTITMLIGLSLLLSACVNDNTIVPSANITTQERFIQDYNGIDVSTAFLVDVEYSATEESIIIEANENLHQFIEVEKVNNILRIKLRDNTSISGSAAFKAHVITSNYLSSFSASQASHITLVNPQESAEVNVGLTGASFLTGTIKANSITAFIDGASNASLQGSADNFTLNADGASLVGSFEMITNNASLQLSGASNASLTVNGIINLTASGASIFTFKGTGVVNQLDLSGGAQIFKAD
jgi:hypothetical protein